MIEVFGHIIAVFNGLQRDFFQTRTLGIQHIGNITHAFIGFLGKFDNRFIGFTHFLRIVFGNILQQGRGRFHFLNMGQKFAEHGIETALKFAGRTVQFINITAEIVGCRFRFIGNIIKTLYQGFDSVGQLDNGLGRIIIQSFNQLGKIINAVAEFNLDFFGLFGGVFGYFAEFDYLRANPVSHGFGCVSRTFLRINQLIHISAQKFGFMLKTGLPINISHYHPDNGKR